MIQTRSLKIAVLTLSLLMASSVAAAAQQQPDVNYDVTLQLVIGSNEAGAKNETPSDLGPVLKQIRSNFEFSGYRLATTFFGRIASNGNFDYNSVASIEGKDLSSSVPTFLDWSLRDL